MINLSSLSPPNTVIKKEGIFNLPTKTGTRRPRHHHVTAHGQWRSDSEAPCLLQLWCANVSSCFPFLTPWRKTTHILTHMHTHTHKILMLNQCTIHSYAVDCIQSPLFRLRCIPAHRVSHGSQFRSFLSTEISGRHHWEAAEGQSTLHPLHQAQHLTVAWGVWSLLRVCPATVPWCPGAGETVPLWVPSASFLRGLPGQVSLELLLCPLWRCHTDAILTVLSVSFRA